MANTPEPAPLPAGDTQRFSDPAAEPVYVAIKSLDLASQHELLELLRFKLHAEDVSAEATQSTRVAHALTAVHAAARKVGQPLSVEEYRRFYREGGRDAGCPDDRCIRRCLGSGSWNDVLRRAHLEPKPDGDVVVFQHGHFYTVDELMAALRECDKDLEHPPAYPEYISWVNRPRRAAPSGRRPASMGVFTRLCGGFLDALRVAGLLPSDPSHAIVSAIGFVEPSTASPTSRSRPASVRSRVGSAARRGSRNTSASAG